MTISLYLLEYHSTGGNALKDKNLKVKVPVTSEDTLGALIGDYHEMLPPEELATVRLVTAAGMIIIPHISQAGKIPAKLCGI